MVVKACVLFLVLHSVVGETEHVYVLMRRKEGSEEVRLEIEEITPAPAAGWEMGLAMDWRKRMSLTVVKKRLELEARNGKTDRLIQGYGFSRPYTGHWGASLVAQLVKRIHLQCGRPGFNPWVGKIPGEGNSYPLPYSGLENSMECIVHGFAKTWTLLSDFHRTVKTQWRWRGQPVTKEIDLSSIQIKVEEGLK